MDSTLNDQARSDDRLQLVDVCRTYRIGPIDTTVLRGVNLEVKSGDLISIMGPSGSGKTTLMNIIGLLDRPTSGACVFNGEDSTRLNDTQLSVLRGRHVGFVFQSFHLLGQLTALDNVALPLVYQGVSRAQMKKRALAVLDKVSMSERVNHRPDQLSGGQKQRVAIARALIVEPTLLLADEPTGALDSDTAQDVMTLLKQMNREQGVTILIITHDPGVARQCSRRLQLDKGQLVEMHSTFPASAAT